MQKMSTEAKITLFLLALGVVAAFGVWLFPQQPPSNQSGRPPIEPPALTASAPPITKALLATSAPVTPLPTASTSHSPQQVIPSCPIYQETGVGNTLEITITVAAGEIAFINTLKFDDKSGGVFVTITGPYSGRHTLQDGAFCGGIPITADYEAIRQQRRQVQNMRKWDITLPAQAAAGPTPIDQPTGQQTICGSGAFGDDSYRSRNPLFKRPDGYTSGWITSDPSDIRLPNGSLRAIMTRYTLIVEDLAELQILNVPLVDDHAGIWGCWYRNDLTTLVSSDAEAEYTKMQQDGSSVPVKLYRVTSDGVLEEIAPSSQSFDMVVPSSAGDGVNWCTSTSGRHEIRFKSGSYSPWPTNDGCDPKGCWKGTVFIYKNTNSDTIFAGSAKGEPQNPLLRVGWDGWKTMPAESEAASQALDAGYLDLQKGDCLTLITIDERQAYNFPASNRGEVVVSITAP